MNTRLIPPLVGAALSTFLLIASSVEGTGRFVLDPRNVALSGKLASCPSRAAIGGDVRVGHSLDGNLVFDVRSCKGDARLIDSLHLLLQFGETIRDTRFDQLVIVSGGEEVYRLPRSDLDELARQYGLGARIWAFNHWPERLRTPDGARAYSRWTGGILGVTTAQLEDLNRALRAWLGNASAA